MKTCLVSSPLTHNMYSWESLKSELWASSSVAAINCHSTNHLAWARSEHWNVFFSKPSSCWHLDVAWLEPGQRSLLLSICSRGILSWYFELSRGVKTWNSTSSSSKQPSDFVGYLLLGRRRDTTCFSIQSLLFYWDENIMFLLQDLWVTPCKWSLLLCSFAWESVLYINTAQLCIQSCI